MRGRGRRCRAEARGAEADSRPILKAKYAVLRNNAARHRQGVNRKTYGTKFKMPVVYYSQLVMIAYGGSAKEAGLDGNVIRAT